MGDLRQVELAEERGDQRDDERQLDLLTVEHRRARLRRASGNGSQRTACRTTAARVPRMASVANSSVIVEVEIIVLGSPVGSLSFTCAGRPQFPGCRRLSR